VALVDGRRLVFLDETGAKTNMTRRYGRARKGVRADDRAPHGHWNTTTLLAAVSWKGASAPMVLDGALDRDAFEAYVEQCLVPTLHPGNIVVLDNLGAHKTPKGIALIEATGAEVRFLPPYSPDFNPIEQMWSKVKNDLRTAKARTQETLWTAVAQALARVTPDDARGWFKHCLVCI